MDVDWIAAHLDAPTVRIVEVDVSAAAYNSGHISGALLWNTYTDLRHPDYTPLGKAELETLLSKSGLTPDTTIVFYGYAPHLGFLLMKSYGHDLVRLMDGPREQWQRAGYPWSLEVPVPAPTEYVIPVRSPKFLSSREIMQGMIGGRGGVIVDTRSQAEYDGERFWPSGATEGAGRPGHVPGAVHVPIDVLRTEDGDFRGIDEMRQVLNDLGITPNSKVVSYCTIGNRASQAWFALTFLLGYSDASVYYGSWAEWGSRSDTPIEI